MRLLLDTVTFIWSINSPERLSRRALKALQDHSALLELSAVSLSEIAIKKAKGKLSVRKDEVIAGIADLQLRVLSYTRDHAYQLFTLPLHHLDPFDRQIISQALVEQIPIVTCDEKFKLYKEVEVIW
ncbi:MAG: type II toxin-antitoxin system VapC family toxin [Candidatus Melainabacteria bacterium]|nr:type II toxin-antitoxin system VapC family toxin [Candidatus Melainabacteria bacterium]